MKESNYIILLLCFSVLSESKGSFWSDSVEWLTTKLSPCHYIDCCNKRWNSSDFDDLFSKLQNEVYGQHIALEIILPALRGHLLPMTPKTKALVISLHGRPGIGKNYVTSLIEKKLFHKYGHTDYVHFFSGRNHFPIQSERDLYRENLRHWILRNVSNCEYSMFIFDEVDKMPPGVLDVLVPYVDYHEKVDGVDFRKSTFILISNTGGDIIAKEYLQIWKSGRKRYSLQLNDFEHLIMLGAFNEKGGLYRSDTIESSLIDHYVPFLPLEEEHVRKCIKNEFKRRNKERLADIYSDEILKDITFGPDDNPIFSNGGCKRIAPKVAAIIERSYFRRERGEL